MEALVADFQFIYREFPWFWWIVVFIFGAIVGSFLNVCIYRIPAGKSVIVPGSRGADGEKIAWYDNIPIFSWFILGGKSRATGKRFSPRYPAVEALTATLFLWSWLAHPPLVAMAGWVLIAFMIAATFIDLDHMIIPDRFSVGGMLTGLVLALFLPSLHGIAPGGLEANFRSFLAALTGALIGSACVYWLATLATLALRKEAMGEGDVKLVGAIGAFCGWQGGVFSLFGGAVLGTIVLVPIMLFQAILNKGDNSGERETGSGSQGGPLTKTPNDPGHDSANTRQESTDEELSLGVAVPFGPMLATAGVLHFLWLHEYVDAYFEEIRAMFLTPW
jgi:leader peptidase (prepilin peptidase)/N-methyltransferase